MASVYVKLLHTKAGNHFINWIRGDTGRKIDKYVVKYVGFSPMMHIFSAWIGYPPIPVLMIYTIGRKSGQERSTAMPYMMVEGRTYLIGSNGAKPRDPFWVENLRANPNARIYRNRKQERVTARLLAFESEERARVWAHARTLTPQYDNYAKETARKIPVIALEYQFPAFVD